MRLCREHVVCAAVQVQADNPVFGRAGRFGISVRRATFRSSGSAGGAVEGPFSSHTAPQPLVGDPLPRQFTLAGLERVGTGEDPAQVPTLDAKRDGRDDAVFRGGEERTEFEHRAEAGQRREVRVGRDLTQEGGEEGEFDAPGRLGRTVDMVLDERSSERGACST